MFSAASQGFLTSLSLIVAIGSQNAFVLRQGLAGRHIVLVCLICSVCDFVLMSAGVLGLGANLGSRPWLSWLLACGGTVFLFCYGARALRSAWKRESTLDVEAHGARAAPVSLLGAAAATLAVTLLNPHVYLDTVVMVGGIATSLSSGERVLFLVGASLASASWFFSLGLGARKLRPVFARPSAWRVLDGLIGVVMWVIGFSLAGHVVRTIPT
ncbi:LysE/ArgO family amino acid transporter [Polyangium jinanense]|uniref:Amino acid transporter n=1 Tax=Polyangium jinanense TaxID=2829994 RepID=A0A9X3X789_9BACT|nr:LysE/ArgO family amino acid transporter [Polyangium jinanense]MDC3953882.1 amino acid transporter [Polyangium jinanense]MDC3983880.1 amino acid transporter [Polyangium jinanense]